MSFLFYWKKTAKKRWHSSLLHLGCLKTPLPLPRVWMDGISSLTPLYSDKIKPNCLGLMDNQFSQEWGPTCAPAVCTSSAKNQLGILFRKLPIRNNCKEKKFLYVFGFLCLPMQLRKICALQETQSWGMHDLLNAELFVTQFKAISKQQSKRINKLLFLHWMF